MDDLRQAAISGARWTLAARIGLQLVTWPITIVVMRLLEPDAYGVFAIAILVQGFVSMFAELGFGVALVQAPQVSNAQARMAVSLVMMLNAAAALLVVMAAPWIADKYDEPELTGVIRVMSIELLVAAVGAVPLALLERELRFRAISVAQLAGGVAGALMTLALALGGAGVWSLVGGTLANALVRTVGWQRAYGRILWPGPVALRTVRPMTHVGGHALAARILWFGSTQFDNLVLGLLLQARALGAYSVSAQLAMLPAHKAMEAVNRVAFPVLCRASEAPDELRSGVRRLRGLLALYGFGICWGLAGVAPEFIAVVLGEKWAVALWPLSALALVAPLRLLAAFNNTAATAAGRPEAATYELALATLLIPAAVGAGAWMGGLPGASLAWLVVYPGIFTFSVRLTAASLREPWIEAVRPAAMPALAGAAMFGTLWALRGAIGTALPQGALLALLLAAGAAVYLGVLQLAARALLGETRQFAGDLLGIKRAG